MGHEGLRMTWFETGLALVVVVAHGGAAHDDPAAAAFDAAVADADVLVAVDPADGSPVARWLGRPSVAAVPTVAVLGAPVAAAAAAAARVARAPAFPATPWARAAAALPFTRTAAAVRAHAVATAMWGRGHGDDVLTALLVLVDAGGTRLATVDAFRGRGPATLICMLRHCREATLACVTDPDCKAGLDCLAAVPPGDQVAAYRCIVSHESAAFEAFSLCVLTRHRCLGVDAAVPTMPAPAPQAEWRGAPLTAEAGTAVFVGWLDASAGAVDGGAGGGAAVDSGAGGGAAVEGGALVAPLPWSWRVAAGLSPAFDQFPNQIQLFQRVGTAFWYDPVFQVDTLAGARVWRRRHYRVRPVAGPTGPAVYHFSVLDNGVVSQEVWRILDAPDDLAYAVFVYVGAAAASGQAYVGAVLCTPDGGPPPARHADRLAAALARVPIEPWELFYVRNAPMGAAELDGAPLELAPTGKGE